MHISHIPGRKRRCCAEPMLFSPVGVTAAAVGLAREVHACADALALSNAAGLHPAGWSRHPHAEPEVVSETGAVCVDDIDGICTNPSVNSSFNPPLCMYQFGNVHS
eukprot:365509-Chlamydomonas_euryale.AAC.18